MATVRVVPVDQVVERSTEAARNYIGKAIDRLTMELERYGDEARQTRYYQEVEDSISDESIKRMWPHADLSKISPP